MNEKLRNNITCQTNEKGRKGLNFVFQVKGE